MNPKFKFILIQSKANIDKLDTAFLNRFEKHNLVISDWEAELKQQIETVENWVNELKVRHKLSVYSKKLLI